MHIKSQPNNTCSVGYLTWVATINGPMRRMIHDVASERDVDLQSSLTFLTERDEEGWTFEKKMSVYLHFRVIDEANVRLVLNECRVVIPPEVDRTAQRPAWLADSYLWQPSSGDRVPPALQEDGLLLIVCPNDLTHDQVISLARFDPRLVVRLTADPAVNRAAWDAAVKRLRRHPVTPCTPRGMTVWELSKADVGDFDADAQPPFGIEASHLGSCGSHISCLSDLLAERNRWIYLNGDCWDFALALHRQTGWPVHGAFDEEDVLCHVAVAHPDGGWVDIRGWIMEMPGAASVRPVSWELIARESERLIMFAPCENGRVLPMWKEPWRHGFLVRTAGLAALLHPDLHGPDPHQHEMEAIAP